MSVDTSADQPSPRQRDSLRGLLATATALLESMDKSVRVGSGDDERYSSYREYARKYNGLLDAVRSVIGIVPVVDRYNIPGIPGVGDTLVSQQKELFDSVHANLSILKAFIETKLSFKTGEVSGLSDFFAARLRAAVMDTPNCEKDIQDVVEQLLIGRGSSKGEDYDREAGRVKVSVKEAVPDFVLHKLGMAIEVKLSKDRNRSREIVDEINADIRAYSKKYTSMLFIVYDLGSIRDEAEFKRDLESADGVRVIVVKH